MENSQNWWFFGLWALWAALLFGGFIFGKAWADGTRRMPVWTRMASSLALAVAAWSFYALPAQTPQSVIALWFSIGMTLGFIGDLFMARLIVKSDLHVLWGMSAFGLGHIAYIIGMVSYASRLSMTPAWLVVWWLIGVAGWSIVVFRAPGRSVLHYAALPYTLLLSSTVGVAMSVAAADTISPISGFTVITIGAALFLLSDLILAAELFRKAHFRLISDVVWLTYGPGQMLIVYSLLLLANYSPFIYGSGGF
jgi:hypothetical protein